MKPCIPEKFINNDLGGIRTDYSFYVKSIINLMLLNDGLLIQILRSLRRWAYCAIFDMFYCNWKLHSKMRACEIEYNKWYFDIVPKKQCVGVSSTIKVSTT